MTSELSQNPAGPGFDPQTGNWTTSATDAQVTTVGPALEITRDYNSQDPRLSGAFGAGWSSVLDMKVSPGRPAASGTTATQVVTYPDGRAGRVRPEPRRVDVLPAAGPVRDPGPGLRRRVHPDRQERHGLHSSPRRSAPGCTGSPRSPTRSGTPRRSPDTSGQITTITSASGRTLTSPGPPRPVRSYPHVASVVTDDATAGNPATAQTWTYSYSGDDLSAACPPASDHRVHRLHLHRRVGLPGRGAGLRPARRTGGWTRRPGATAASSVLANEGTDNATYNGVTLGQDAGPLAGSSATAATFNGSSSYVTLPAEPGDGGGLPDHLAVVQDQQPPTGCCSPIGRAAQRGPTTANYSPGAVRRQRREARTASSGTATRHDDVRGARSTTGSGTTWS